MFSNLRRAQLGGRARATPSRILLTGLALTATIAVMVSVPALAGSVPSHPVTTAAIEQATNTATAPPGHLVLLPTGQYVLVSGVGSTARVAIHRTPGDTGESMVTLRRPTGTYVVPASAVPYLGHGLDRELFNITRTDAAAAKVPVHLTYHSKRPAVAGVTVTSASGGVADGYLTATSARAFGRSVRARFAADAKGGWKQRPALLSNGATLTSTSTIKARTETKKATPVTLTVKAIGADGQPLTWGEADLFSTEDSWADDGSADVEFKNGVGVVKMAPGDYSLEAFDITRNGTGDEAPVVRVRYLTLPDLKLSGKTATATVDYRKATLTPQVVTPKPQQTLDYAFSLLRTDRLNQAWGTELSNDQQGEILLAPMGKAKVGKQSVGHGWQLAAPGDKLRARYTYDLAATQDDLPSDPTVTFTDADLATVHATYYGDGSGRTGAFLRYAGYLIEGEAGVGTFQDVAAGSRTEYVGFKGPRASGLPQWFEQYAANGMKDHYDDLAFFTNMGLPVYRKGTTTRADWGRGPLAAGVPHQNDDNGGFCFMCRGKNSMNVLVAPFLDTNDHVGGLVSPSDSIANVRFRLYLGTKKIDDIEHLADISEDFSFAGDDSVKVGAAKGTFKAVFDIDRRTQDPRLSTRSQTTVTFTSARDAGRRPPTDWYCLASTYNCRVLPVLLAQVNLPTATDGSLPAGKSAVTLKVARVQHAAGSAVKTARVQIRFHGYGWTTLKLTSKGKGVYTATLDNAKFAGQVADLHIVATDQGGSRFEQTVVSAYRVAAN